MDRFDEKKDRNDADEMERTGDVLGLGGAAVPKMPGDPNASTDRDQAGGRRREEDESLTSDREDPYKQTSGATGIDMGSGGRGTDVSGR